MSAGTLILMTIVLTIPMFLRGKIEIDKLLNLETRFDDSPCDDSACDDSDFCNAGKCVNACYNISCHQNEVCRTSNHISSCECVPNFKRNNKGECEKVEKCTRDEDCDSSKLCTNGMCVIGCDEKCNVNEICQGKNRTFSCECIPDYSRDSDNKCRRQCSYNEICDWIEDCQNGLCKPVVIHSDKCGLNAVGIRVLHKQLCACPRGFGGDPYRHCLKRCKTNYECEDSEICHDNLCSNACLPSLKKCPYEQKCEVKNHIVNCLNESSEYKYCKTSGDCDEKSYCAGGHSLCIPLCDPQSCSDNEFCYEKTFFSSKEITIRGTICTCDANPILVHGSRKCSKLCDSDEICEENEHCNYLNWCVPKQN